MKPLRQQFPRDNKKAGLVSVRMSSYGIHGKDDTLLFPTYSNILFFIALLPTGGGVASCVIFGIKSELNFVIRYSFSKDNGSTET